MKGRQLWFTLAECKGGADDGTSRERGGKKKSKKGGGGSSGEDRVRAFFLGFFLFCDASPLIAKKPPPLLLSFGSIFIGKMLLGP